MRADTAQTNPLLAELVRIDGILETKATGHIDTLEREVAALDQQTAGLRAELRSALPTQALTTAQLTELYDIQQQATIERDQYQRLLARLRDMETQAKCIASICHGAWINISAEVVKGYRYTSTPGIKDDLINAGVSEWVNEEVVVDRHHVSSRRPDDCPAFCRAIIGVMTR